MRNQLLCALAVLSVAQIAQAQQVPGYANTGYGLPNATNYMVPAVPYGYYGYSPYGMAAPTAYPIPQGVWMGAAPQYDPGYAGYSAFPYSADTMPAQSPGMASVDAAAIGDLVGGPTQGERVLSSTTVGRPLIPGMPLMPAIEDDTTPDDYQGPGDWVNAFHRPCKESFWISAGYTMSWFKAEHPAGPLATTGAVTDTVPGAIGQPGTASLFGTNNTDYGMFSGVKAEIGFYLDPKDQTSVELSGFYMAPNHVRASDKSDANGDQIIARPFYNVLTGSQSDFLDSFPGLFAGGVTVDSRSELFGSELNLRQNVYGFNKIHADGLFGLRYASLRESLTIQDQFQPLAFNTLTFGGPSDFVNPGSTVVDQDRFQTTNDFYGAQIGGRIQWEEDWFVVGVFGKAAFGVTNETVDITGESALYVPGAAPQSIAGGVLTAPSNIGTANKAVFGFMPEVGANLAVNVTKNIQLTATYSFLYWNQVARPQGQVDMAVNQNLVPTNNTFGLPLTGSVRPTLNFSDESFWTNTITLGVTIHY
jgi:hypothetical protein